MFQKHPEAVARHRRGELQRQDGIGERAFKDFAVFARQWHHSDPNSAEAAQHDAADFDNSGTVDVNDLGCLAYYWLLSPKPPAAAPDANL